MFDYRKLHDRYMNDAVFYALVQSLESAIKEHGFDPDELRQAAFFASIKYKHEHIGPMLIDGKLYEFIPDRFSR